MPLDKHAISGFLEEADKELDRGVTLIAVGGTAMTLLDVKPSTIDVDFTVPSDDYDDFQNALKKIPHGFKIDCWKDGMVFSQMLPSDYVKKSLDIRKLNHIRLKALNPVDIVVTKIGRLDERDRQDIQACIKKFKLTKSQVAKRAQQVQYVGRDENYEINLRHVLENCFR